MGNQESALEGNVQNFLTPSLSTEQQIENCLVVWRFCQDHPRALPIHTGLWLQSLCLQPCHSKERLPSLYGRGCCLCQALTPSFLALDLDLPLTKAITRASGLSSDPNLPSKPLGTCRLKKFTPTQGHTFVSMRNSNKMRRQRNMFKQNSKIKPRKKILITQI